MRNSRLRATTIVLAEDHHVVRQGLRALFEAEPSFSVIGEAANGLEALDVVEEVKPDVLIVDLMMPGLNGLEVTRRVRHRFPHTRVVILSMYPSEAYVLEALRNGASGYVVKDAGAADLMQAVREAAAGRRYLSPPLSDRAVEAYAEKSQGSTLDVYETLTDREREILQLVADGKSNTEIAARLSISPRTAETHRANVMRKLGLRNQTDLVRYALCRGIVPMENNVPGPGAGGGKGELADDPVPHIGNHAHELADDLVVPVVQLAGFGFREIAHRPANSSQTRVSSASPSASLSLLAK